MYSAFVPAAALPAVRPVVQQSSRVKTKTTPSMASAPMSRRSALRLAGLAGMAGAAALAGATAPVRASSILEDLEEVKKDVKAISYSDEVLDQGPDGKEKLIVREKKRPKENVDVARLEVAEEVEEAKYDKMLASEAEEAERVKSLFSKRKK